MNLLTSFKAIPRAQQKAPEFDRGARAAMRVGTVSFISPGTDFSITFPPLIEYLLVPKRVMAFHLGPSTNTSTPIA